MFNWNSFQRCSIPFVWPPGSKYLIILFAPNSHEKLIQQLMLESVRTLLRISHLASRKVHYLPQFTQFRSSLSVQTLLRITCLANRKSYLVIIDPNADKRLTKSEIMSSWSRFEQLRKITLAIIIPNAQEKFTSGSDMKSWPNLFYLTLFGSDTYGRALGPEGKFLFFVLATFISKF